MSVLMAVLERLGIRAIDITTDSRALQEGSVFLALPGLAEDGRKFIPEAVRKGAAAVLWEQSGVSAVEMRALCGNLPQRGVENLRAQLGEFASAFFGHPSQQLTLIGVTGTNGKTSCTHWLAQAFSALGQRSAVIGTVGYGLLDQLQPLACTTPDVVSLHRMLARFVQQGIEVVALEVSSHGLEQQRVAGATFSTALFTNLTRDHLDYHGDMGCYGEAKARLFQFPGLRHAVVHRQASTLEARQYSDRLCTLARQQGARVLTYGFEAVDIRCVEQQLKVSGTDLTVETPQGIAQISSVLLGNFNMTNLLGVLGVLLAEGVPLSKAVSALAVLRSVPGRMQRISDHSRPLVVVDYAHTPDALWQALKTLKELVPNGRRLLCVFGCGGDRDPGKRPLMGKIAGELADYTVVTSDNPRTEDPEAIISQIVAGMNGRYEVQSDRREAIASAILEADEDDIVLIAGKGHERVQIYGTQAREFDDVSVARTLIQQQGCHG